LRKIEIEIEIEIEREREREREGGRSRNVVWAGFKIYEMQIPRVVCP